MALFATQSGSFGCLVRYGTLNQQSIKIARTGGDLWRLRITQISVGRRTGDKEEEEVFDSRELRDGDMFAVTLFRPGTYAVVNVKNRARGEIGVAYPKMGDVPYRPPDPVSIGSTVSALRPDRITILPGQGQLYRIGTPSRIKIELVTPDDGPKDAQPPRIMGWAKLATTPSKPVEVPAKSTDQARIRRLREKPSR